MLIRDTIDDLMIHLTTDMPNELKTRLEKQGYHLLGDKGRAAFKACQWQRKSLVFGDVCYKEKFYGIQSHRCLQMTPVVDKCTQNCEFCWRVIPSDVGVGWNQTSVSREDVMEPASLLDSVLVANLRSLGGYNPEVDKRVSMDKYLEAREPKHLAISLAGEPTLYPMIGELIDEAHSRGMTTFLVTNGTKPEVLKSMTLPTQLYVTLAAPDEDVYRTLCRPGIRGGWERIMESQNLLGSLKTRTVNRLTMVSKKNMDNPRGYSKLILRGEPDFVEVKGYMHLGSARGRLSSENAPSHRAIRAFAKAISALTGYYLSDEQPESRVVLLSRSKHVERLNTN
ncbi:MAG: 4-demethylwyosine synthase TYW1 [Candidatus Thorarchaeota archaeon]